MKNILEEIAARTRERIAKRKDLYFCFELEKLDSEVNKNAGRELFSSITKRRYVYIW